MSEKPREIPECPSYVAHPQSVWFYFHWRPIIDALSRESAELKRKLEHMNAHDKSRVNALLEIDRLKAELEMRTDQAKRLAAVMERRTAELAELTALCEKLAGALDEAQAWLCPHTEALEHYKKHGPRAWCSDCQSYLRGESDATFNERVCEALAEWEKWKGK